MKEGQVSTDLSNLIIDHDSKPRAQKRNSEGLTWFYEDEQLMKERLKLNRSSYNSSPKMWFYTPWSLSN